MYRVLEFMSNIKNSYGAPTCVGVLDYNLLSNTENTFRGEGFLEGLESKERKYLLVCLRDYL
jgi:hypothetical protein